MSGESTRGILFRAVPSAERSTSSLVSTTNWVDRRDAWTTEHGQHLFSDILGRGLREEGGRTRADRTPRCGTGQVRPAGQSR